MPYWVCIEGLQEQAEEELLSRMIRVYVEDLHVQPRWQIQFLNVCTNEHPTLMLLNQ